MSEPLLQTLQISEAEENRELAGPERAAVLLLALGDEHGKAIWDKMDDIEIEP